MGPDLNEAHIKAAINSIMKFVTSEAEIAARYNIAFRFTETFYGLLFRVFRVRAKILFRISRFSVFPTRIFLLPTVGTKYPQVTNKKFKKALVGVSDSRSFNELSSLSIKGLSYTIGIHPHVTDIINQSARVNGSIHSRVTDIIDQSAKAYKLPNFATLNTFLTKSVRSSILPKMSRGESNSGYSELTKDSNRSEDFLRQPAAHFKKSMIEYNQFSFTSLPALKLSNIAIQSMQSMRKFQMQSMRKFQKSISSSHFIANIAPKHVNTHLKHVNSIKKNKTFQLTKIKDYVQSYQKGYMHSDNNFPATSDGNTLDWKLRDTSRSSTEKRIGFSIYSLLPVKVLRSLKTVAFNISLKHNVVSRLNLQSLSLQSMLPYLRSRPSNGTLHVEQLEIPAHHRVVSETERIQRSMARKWFNITRFLSTAELHSHLNQLFSQANIGSLEPNLDRGIFKSIHNKLPRPGHLERTSLSSNSWPKIGVIDKSTHFSDPHYKPYSQNEFSYNINQYGQQTELVDLNRTLYDHVSSELPDMDFELFPMSFATDWGIIKEIKDAIAPKNEFFDSIILGEFSNSHKHEIIEQLPENLTIVEKDLLESLFKELKRYGY